MTVRKENEIWQDVFSLLNGVLTEKGYKTLGWSIKQGNQPTILGLKDNSIWITRIASKRYGWQGHKNTWHEETQKMIHSEIFYQDILFQISAFHKRSKTDLTEITAGDVLNDFITYLQSIKGTDELRDKGFCTPRISELREPPIISDSEIYEKLPSFDFSFTIKQNEESEIPYTNNSNIFTRENVIKGV